jgi:RNA polymerase sigma-70 factor (ECF subfamily)
MMIKANVFLLNTAAIGNKASDEELVRNILAGAATDFEVLMNRHNQRLYRVCRSVAANGSEAEAAVQEAYFRAYRNLEQFSGQSRFITWLTKIAIYEALALRRHSATALHAMRPQLVTSDSYGHPLQPDSARLLEQAIDALPPNYRTVFVLGGVEGVSDDETADCLLLSRETVELRLLRATRMLQERLPSHLLDRTVERVFLFGGARSADLIERVARRIAQGLVPQHSETAP